MRVKRFKSAKKIALFVLFSSVLTACYNEKKNSNIVTKIDGIIQKDREEISLDEFDDVNTYFVYREDNGNLFYSSEFLKKKVYSDYSAYYDALSGKLVHVDFNNEDLFDLKEYNSYIKNNLIEIGNAKDLIYQCDNLDNYADGINLDNNTINEFTVRLMDADLGYLTKDEVYEITENYKYYTR